MKIVLRSFLVLVLLAAPAAAEVALTGGRSVTLKNKPGDERDGAKIAFKGDPALATPADPRCAAGNTTVLTLTAAVDAVREIVLPCGLWAAKSWGYLYRDPDATHGGVRQVKYGNG